MESQKPNTPHTVGSAFPFSLVYKRGLVDMWHSSFFFHLLEHWIVQEDGRWTLASKEKDSRLEVFFWLDIFPVCTVVVRTAPVDASGGNVFSARSSLLASGALRTTYNHIPFVKASFESLVNVFIRGYSVC